MQNSGVYRTILELLGLTDDEVRGYGYILYCVYCVHMMSMYFWSNIVEFHPGTSLSDHAGANYNC